MSIYNIDNLKSRGKSNVLSQKEHACSLLYNPYRAWHFQTCMA